MQKRITLTILAIFCSSLLLISDNQYAFAINVMTITAPASSVVNEGAYQVEGLTTNKAYLVGQQNGANGTIYIKNHNSATSGSDATDTSINLNNFRSGTSNAHTVVYVPRTNASATWNQWVVYTNLGAFSFQDSTDSIVQNIAGGGGSQIDECKFDSVRGVIYCLNTVSDLVWKINPASLEVAMETIDTGSFTTTLAFDIDETSGFMFIVGSNTLGTTYVQRYDIKNIPATLDYSLNSDSACDDVSQGVAVDTVKDMFWVSCSADSSIRKITQAGSVVQTISSISTPRFMEIDSVARRLYVVSDTTDQVQIFDIDSNVAISTQGVCNYGNLPIDTRRQSNHTKTFIPCSGTSHSQLIDDSSAVFQNGGLQDEDTTVCIDTTGDTETDVCFTDTNNDGVPDAGPAGALGVQRGQANITNLGFQINCSFGIGSCTDKNPKTNGVGLMYLAILIILSYSALVFIHLKAQSDNPNIVDALRINPVLLLTVLVIDVTFVFVMGWIQDLVFYTVMALMIGLAGFGIYRQVRSGGSE